MQTAIDEGRTGAIFALGLAQAIGVETWIRLVDRRERAPDVRVMYVDNTGSKGSHRMNTLQVEVVTYTKHSAEGLADFLFKVKLDPSKKAYSSDTVVVGFIQRGASPGEVQAAHTELVERGAGGLCYVIGRLDESRFQVVQVVPNLRGPEEVDLDDAFKSTQAPVAETKRGMSSASTLSEKLIPTANPFLELF